MRYIRKEGENETIKKENGFEKDIRIERRTEGTKERRNKKGNM